MARLARVVVPGLPHHVTQRGNHREAVFFGDHRAYLDLISRATFAEAQLAGADDGVVVTAPLLARDFAGMLDGAEDEAATRALLASCTTGRPVGAADWIKALETGTGRSLAPAKRGPKPKGAPADAGGELFQTGSP